MMYLAKEARDLVAVLPRGDESSAAVALNAAAPVIKNLAATEVASE